MKKISLFLMCLMCAGVADAASTGRAGRNVVGAGAGAKVYRSAADNAGMMSVERSAQTETVEPTAAVVDKVLPDETILVPTVDPELEEIKKQRNICVSNNIGMSNTFVWAKKNISTDNYMLMVEDVNDPFNNTCYVKVDLKSGDNRIDLSDIKGKYFEMGQSLVCGSWIDESMLEKRILDGTKKARNWGIAASVVGGAGVGVGAMELFGNKLIGGKVEGQKALEGQELMVSQLKVLQKENAAEYKRVLSALEELEKNCADNTLWNGNKPADCDAATNPFIGLLEKLK